MGKKRVIPQRDLDAIATLADPDLRALAGARLFVTGGTGYVGRWLLESLVHADAALELNVRAVVLSRDPGRFAQLCPAIAASPVLSFIQGDVRDFVFPDGAFDFAIHAATDVIAEHAPLETFDVTVGGTRRVLDFCVARGVRRVLLLSSGAVYGPIPPGMTHVAETYGGGPRTDQPQSAYGIGKAVTEWLGAAYGAAHGIMCPSARVFAQIGPHLALDKQFAAGNFIRDALAGGVFDIRGDGTPRRSYMYGVDLAAWLWAILARGQGARAYNVGSDEGMSILALAEMVAQAAGISSPVINVHGSPVPGAAPAWYVPDIARARDELGLTISVPAMEAIMRTLAWYREAGI